VKGREGDASHRRESMGYGLLGECVGKREGVMLVCLQRVGGKTSTIWCKDRGKTLRVVPHLILLNIARV
jgi:hypothetical protein